MTIKSSSFVFFSKRLSYFLGGFSPEGLILISLKAQFLYQISSGYNSCTTRLSYAKRSVELYEGNVLNGLPKGQEERYFGKVNAIITSPPYAQQRRGVYEGVNEEDYPDFTLEYFEKLRPLLKDNGSIFIIIRPHISNGQISDYVLRTRLLLRTRWTECEELIWVKSTSPPLGSIQRPRRSWESILWFGKSGKVFCNTKAGNKKTSRSGFYTSKHASGDSFLNYGQSHACSQISRETDVVTAGVHEVDTHLTHPAMFPEPLSRWLINMSTPEGGTVLDPFSGSGTTGISCLRSRRAYIGIELEPHYIEESVNRFEREFEKLAFNKREFNQISTYKSETVHNNTVIGF